MCHKEDISLIKGHTLLPSLFPHPNLRSLMGFLMMGLLSCSAKAQTLLVLPIELSEEGLMTDDELEVFGEVVRQSFVSDPLGLEILDKQTSAMLVQSARSLGTVCVTKKTLCSAEIGAIADADYVISVWVEPLLEEESDQPQTSKPSDIVNVQVTITLVSVDEQFALRRSNAIFSVGPYPGKKFTWEAGFKNVVAPSLFRPDNRLALLEIETTPAGARVTVNGRESDDVRAGIQIFEVKVGSATLEAGYNGFAHYEQTFELGPEQRLRHHVQLTLASPPVAVPESAPKEAVDAPNSALDNPSESSPPNDETLATLATLSQVGMAAGVVGIGAGLGLGAFAGFSAWRWSTQNEILLAEKNRYSAESYDSEKVDEARFLIGVWEWAPAYALLSFAQISAGCLVTAASGTAYYFWIPPPTANEADSPQEE